MKLMLIGNDVSIYIMYKSYNHQKQVEYGVVSWRFIPRLFRKHLLWFFKPNLSHVNSNISWLFKSQSFKSLSRLDS